MARAEQLTNIARGIIDRHFPGEWDIFERSDLATSIEIYEQAIKDGWTPKEADIHFRSQVFEAGKRIYKLQY